MKNGKMDLERIMVWANFIDNFKIGRIINTEIEKIINICNEQILKSRQKENEKKMEKIKEESENIQCLDKKDLDINVYG